MKHDADFSATAGSDCVSHCTCQRWLRQRAELHRASSLNTLRTLSLAWGMHCDANGGKYLPHALFSKDGKALLSWRVLLLPELGEQALYAQFHLDEPWDSENNKSLIAKMPDWYGSLGGRPKTEGRTRYKMLVGINTVFGRREPAIQRDISARIGSDDQVADTIVFVEVEDKDAVVWTKPEDVEFDADNPFAGITASPENGINVGFSDGRAVTLRQIDAAKMRKMVLR